VKHVINTVLIIWHGESWIANGEKNLSLLLNSWIAFVKI